MDLGQFVKLMLVIIHKVSFSFSFKVIPKFEINFSQNNKKEFMLHPKQIMQRNIVKGTQKYL